MKNFLQLNITLLAGIISLLMILGTSDLMGQMVFASPGAADIYLEGPNTTEGYSKKAYKPSANEKVRTDFLQAGIQLYHQGNWAESSVVLEKYVENYTQPLEHYELAMVTLARNKMNTGAYLQCAMLLRDALSLTSLDLTTRNEAEYLEAVAWLRLNEIEGKKFMNAIAKDKEHPFANAAQGILGAI